MVGESSPTAPTLTGIAAILQAVAWPCVAIVFFLLYRTKLISILDILALKLRQAKHVKAGQIEIDTEQEIHEAVEKAGEQASEQGFWKEVPEKQVQAARAVGDKLQAAPIEFRDKLDFAHREIYDLIDQYESVRRSMPSGNLRTRKMNEIAAKMRTLSIAVYPLLTSLVKGRVPGERLAAICVLQVRPELGYFDWLIERVMREDQPFLFFHASLAILELVRTFPYLSTEIAGKSIRDALQRIRSFPGGRPDQNTIEVLEQALAKLGKS
jgi:hypothetical protein